MNIFCLSIYLFMDMSYCYILGTENSAAMYTFPQFLFEYLSIVLEGYISRNRIPGSCDNSMFNFLRNRQTVCFSVVLSYIPTRKAWVPIFPHPHQHLLLFISLMIAILMSIKWYFIVGWFAILMSNDIEHLFSAFWSFVYLHWRNFCLSLLSIF